MIFCHPQANCFHRRLPTATGGAPLTAPVTPLLKGKKSLLRQTENDINNDRNKAKEKEKEKEKNNSKSEKENFIASNNDSKNYKIDDNCSMKKNDINESSHNHNSRTDVPVSTGNSSSTLSDSVRECSYQHLDLELQPQVEVEVEVEVEPEEAGDDADTSFSNESKHSSKCFKLQPIGKEHEECSSLSYNSPPPSGNFFF